MPKTLGLPERIDADGIWHQVLKDRCYWCGCMYLYAEDDRDLVWEPGTRRQSGCSDERCECHASPINGTRRE